MSGFQQPSMWQPPGMIGGGGLFGMQQVQPLMRFGTPPGIADSCLGYNNWSIGNYSGLFPKPIIPPSLPPLSPINQVYTRMNDWRLGKY